LFNESPQTKHRLFPAQLGIGLPLPFGNPALAAGGGNTAHPIAERRNPAGFDGQFSLQFTCAPAHFSILVMLQALAFSKVLPTSVPGYYGPFHKLWLDDFSSLFDSRHLFAPTAFTLCSQRLNAGTLLSSKQLV
jgi:hypothetical protein